MGAKYTPESWEVYEDGGALEIRTALDGDVDSDTGRHIVVGGDLIAAVFDGPHDADHARLIAAAPDMLEALETLAGRLCGDSMSAQDRWDAYAIADAAIAKAGGQQ